MPNDQLPPAETAFQDIMSDLEKHYKVSDRLYDILSDSLGKHLAQALITQERELLEWVRDEVEGMRRKPSKQYSEAHFIVQERNGYNQAIDDIKAKLAQREKLGERES